MVQLAESRAWLVEIRTKKGLTQQLVAEGAGIERSFYNQIETGVRNPSVDTAKKIARVMDFDWTNFFDVKSGEKQHSNVSA